MDSAAVEHLERLLNAIRIHHDAAQGHAAAGAYDRVRHSLDRLHALLDADARRTLTLGDPHATT